MTYLIENDLVSHIRIVDKVPPQTAWLNAHHKKIFEDQRVEFRSANLIIPGKTLVKLSLYVMKAYISETQRVISVTKFIVFI